MLAPRVVILGATGFVAGALTRLLEAEARPCRPVPAREVDLTAASAVSVLSAILKPSDAVVVCSALTPEHGRDRAAFLKNVAMIDHLCAALAAGPVAHVVYISSDAVYAGHDEIITEEAYCETADLYGLAHIVREKMLQAACTSLAIPCAVLRPGAIYGAQDTHNAYGPNRFVRTALAAGRIALFGEGEEQRDHIYVRDVARIIQLSVHQRSAGVLNAVTGVSLTFCEIADTIAGAVGGNVIIENVPRAVPVVHRHFDAAALRTAFPEFHPMPFDAAIRETIATLRP